MELKGKLVKLLPEVTGEGKNGTWKKQDFVVETLGEYPKTVCFQSWGTTVESVKNLKVGDNLTVYFRLESREFNEKYFTNATAWKIQKEGVATGNKKVEPPPPENKDEDDLPF
jgi:hypothetical protein